MNQGANAVTLRSAHEGVELVRAELHAAGIQAPPRVEPVPSVAVGEVRLVAWMAVKRKRVSQ